MTIVDLLRPSVRVLTASRRTVIMPADLPTLQRSPMPRQRLSSTDITEHSSECALRWRDVGRPDHVGPLLGLLGNELAEVGGRAWKHSATKVGKAGLYF